MPKNVNDVVKGTLSISKLGPGMSKGNLSGSILNTIKLKKDKVSASLAFSDRSLHPPTCKSFTDVVAIVDVKHKEVTANTKYEAGIKKYTVGATWEPKVADGLTTLKAWYSNKDHQVNGEATITLNKAQKSLITFNSKKLLTAKYTYAKGSMIYEPTYIFPREALAMAVTKKIKSDTLKVSYDLRSEVASMEWNHKPFKLTLTNSIKKGLPPTATKPNLSVIYENTF